VIRVVDRMSRLLDAFTPEAAEHTLTELAHATGLNKSSAYRLLTSMEAIGLVEHRDLRWRIGPRPVALANVRLGSLDLRREALHHLRELRQVFRAAIAFSVPDGSDMIYLERLDSPDAYGVSARLGARAPIWSGASGKAALSRMTPPEREARLDVEAWRRLPRQLRNRVMKRIAEAERRGYCVDTGEFFDGIGGVAAAICDPHGAPVAAISVIAPAERLTREYVHSTADRLLAATAELEATLQTH
jgi:IclR family pca regulon transcriptional regulator